MRWCPRARRSTRFASADAASTAATFETTVWPPCAIARRARRLVDGHAVIVATDRVDLTHVDGDSSPKVEPVHRRREPRLERTRRLHRIAGERKHRKVAVALAPRFEQSAVVLLHRVTDLGVEHPDRPGHRFGRRRPQMIAPLEIGHEEGAQLTGHDAIPVKVYVAGGCCFFQGPRSSLGSWRYTGSLMRMPTPAPIRNTWNTPAPMMS